MKLLLDENLSPDLVARLSDLYSELTCVKTIGLEGKDDGLVWNFAKAHGYTILSKDSDFAARCLSDQAAPKIIWIRLGNCSTRAIEMLLRMRVEDIRRFLSEEEKCLRLGVPIRRSQRKD